MQMNKKYFIGHLENILFFIMMIMLAALFLFYSASKTYDDMVIITNDNVQTATITSLEHERKSKYAVTVSYEINANTYTGKFDVTKSIFNDLGNYFNAKYRTGNTIPVLIGNGATVIPVAFVKSTVIRDIVFDVCSLAIIVVIGFLSIHNTQPKIYQNKKEALCILSNCFSMINFIVGVIIFLVTKKISIAFLCISAGLYFMVPEIIIKKEIQMRGFTATYKDNPGMYIFGVLCFLLLICATTYGDVVIIKDLVN